MYPQLGLRFRGNNKGFREIVATGGIITEATTPGGYKYHTFISSTPFNLDVRGTIEYLIIGAGGGGGNTRGGGAGSAVEGEILLDPGSYLVSVGSGGRGSGGRPNQYKIGHRTAVLYPSGNGGASAFAGITAPGGDGGDQVVTLVMDFWVETEVVAPQETEAAEVVGQDTLHQNGQPPREPDREAGTVAEAVVAVANPPQLPMELEALVVEAVVDLR